jgi:hypothetical protein
VKNGGLRNCGVREIGLDISQKISPPKAWKSSGSIEKLGGKGSTDILSVGTPGILPGVWKS